ncbi:contractile injection system tape measure protein [Mongoliitalea daihaiensis]|uniref:contractile injection system tape measure protein n=1 Tax=Mongoliitalea daihaiensis TaxID=2782006 RepID=UPI001EEF03F3|nr:contractile injection system tape measure protein [Mongoliitalea daihaiensis]UJP63806.1 hypothetical protein IPZ59_13325 [Mongoliitalea daihaiensis]
MKEETVVIQKLEFELEMVSSLTAKQLMKYSQRFVHQYILPLLEKLLQSYAFEARIQLSKVNLNLTVPQQLLQQGNSLNLLQALETNLRLQLDTILNEKEDETPAVQPISLAEILPFFLSYGSLPWYVPRSFDLELELTNVFDSSIKTKEGTQLVKQLNLLFIKNPHTFERFVKQLDDRLLLRVLNFGQPVSSFESNIHGLLKKRSIENRLAYWSLLYYAFWYYPQPTQTILWPLREVFQAIGSHEFRTLSRALRLGIKRPMTSQDQRKFLLHQATDLGVFGNVLMGKRLEKVLVTKGKEEKILLETAAKEESPSLFLEQVPHQMLYVSNAGLSIVHPFIVQYFRTLGFLNDHQQILKHKIDKAVYALHFLSFGKTNTMEHALILEKVFCGLPIDYPIDRFIQLEAYEKEEGEKLLRSIIQHWQRLKSTSLEGLREMFIQREGKLELEKPKLIVERKAQDLLMDSLPWGISVIKLPWMKQTLYVNW